jgi:mannose/fructose/N-acetylgalactosamine-specific phosphotransferase system component IIB
MGVVLTRVDERMIHGQVMTVWATLLNVDEAIVVSDEAAHNELQRTVMEISVPAGVELAISTVDEAYETLSHARFNGSRTMIIFKELHDVVRMVDKGYKPDSVDIGGIYHKEGKTEYAKALYLDQNDMNDLKKLTDDGIDVFYQVTPLTAKESIRKYMTV